MKKINTCSSDFSDLRKENKVVFMSRPRRFGKSLSI